MQPGPDDDPRGDAGGVVGVISVGTELLMGAVPPQRAGAAAAVVVTATEFGGALGMAVLGSIGIAAYRSGLAAAAPPGTPPAALAAVRGTLVGAVSVAGRLPGRRRRPARRRPHRVHPRPGPRRGRAAITMILAAVVGTAFFRGVQVESPAATASGEPAAEDRSELAA